MDQSVSIILEVTSAKLFKTYKKSEECKGKMPNDYF